jgi:NADH-quinone oxidoreductase subunit B
MLIDAILKLHQQVQTMPLGPDARSAVKTNETAALAASPTSEMKGLMR